jgi:nucleoside-diphosphate-sugar epimerase
MRVLVTGANGFIGRALVADLARDHRVEVRASSRSTMLSEGRVSWFKCSGFGRDFDWRSSLHDVDAVVHLAGRAHVMRETSREPEREFMAVNRDATQRLAEQSVDAGVRRFVLISSIGVHGDKSLPARPLTEQAPLRPYDAYTRSKAAAEAVTLAVTKGTATHVTILRPAMVYGEGAPGNFSRLVALVRSGLPLPFGSIRNSRSFIARESLVHAIIRCLDHPAAAGRTFVLADGIDYSTPALIREIAAGINTHARLTPCPPHMLRFGLRVMGKVALAQRLLDSLQVDASLARDILGWRPVVESRDAIRRAASETIA